MSLSSDRSWQHWERRSTLPAGVNRLELRGSGNRAHNCKTMIPRLSLTSVNVLMRTMEQGIWKQDCPGVPQWWSQRWIIKAFLSQNKYPWISKTERELSTLLPKLQQIQSWSSKSSTAFAFPLGPSPSSHSPIPLSVESPTMRRSIQTYSLGKGLELQN